jgi:hypothetical protein
MLHSPKLDLTLKVTWMEKPFEFFKLKHHEFFYKKKWKSDFSSNFLRCMWRIGNNSDVKIWIFHHKHVENIGCRPEVPSWYSHTSWPEVMVRTKQFNGTPLTGLRPTIREVCGVWEDWFYYNRIKKNEIQGGKCHVRTMIHSETDKTFKMKTQHVSHR